MKKFFLSVFTVILSISTTYGQEDVANELVALANEMYNFGDHHDAMEIYQQALEFDPDHLEANYMTGVCYLKTTANKANAVDHLLLVEQNNPEFRNKLYYYLAEAYRYDYEFDDAIKNYRRYLQELNTNYRVFAGEDIKALKAKTEKKISECKFAKEYTKKKKDISIRNLGDVVNSAELDYAPTVNASEDVLIFTSRRSGSTGALKDRDNFYYEDIWMSKKNEKGEWGEPENMGDKINSEFHDSNIGLSPDGKTLFIYKTDNNGDIYASSQKKGNKWGKPKPYNKLVNSDAPETSICIGSSGEYMFFSSARDGGQGGLDIYMSKKNKKGKWDDPVNLGPSINTQYGEESPSYHAESNTLYFSSEGHNTMGGFDIFRSIYDEDNNTWSEPENLGYPLNTTDDDLYLVVSTDGKKGYYSSFKTDSKGYSDLYVIDHIDEVHLGEDVAQDTSMISDFEEVDSGMTLIVTIVDPSTRKPIKTNFKIVEKESNHVIDTLTLNNGIYTKNFHSNYVDKTYIIVADADGYIWQSDKIEIPVGVTDTLEKTIPLRKQVLNKEYILRNIYFDFDMATLKPESSVEIEKLKELLNSNPNMTITLGGHTDKIGTHEYNINLSQKRANAVKTYLLTHGISNDRVNAVGYGEDKPLASDDDEEEGRELNRRTEFVITKQ